MKEFHPLSVAEQLVAHIRESISIGELSGTMPGVRKLANTLGVSSNTVVAAVEQLEREGFLESQGHGRRCQIILPENYDRSVFRVSLLLYERDDMQLSYVTDIPCVAFESLHAPHRNHGSNITEPPRAILRWRFPPESSARGSG